MIASNFGGLRDFKNKVAHIVCPTPPSLKNGRRSLAVSEIMDPLLLEISSIIRTTIHQSFYTTEMPNDFLHFHHGNSLKS